MVCHVFHHAKSLTHIAFNLQVHQDAAYESSSHDLNGVRHRNMEAITSDDVSNEGNHADLEAEHKHGSMVSIMNFSHVHLEVLHHAPVECLESHSIRVATDREQTLLSTDLLEESLVLKVFQIFVNLFNLKILRWLVPHVPRMVVRALFANIANLIRDHAWSSIV